MSKAHLCVYPERAQDGRVDRSVMFCRVFGSTRFLYCSYGGVAGKNMLWYGGFQPGEVIEP